MRVVSLIKVSESSRRVEFDAALQVGKLHEANEQGGTFGCPELVSDLGHSLIMWMGRRSARLALESSPGAGSRI
jgi:hypothetical protein